MAEGQVQSDSKVQTVSFFGFSTPKVEPKVEPATKPQTAAKSEAKSDESTLAAQPFVASPGVAQIAQVEVERGETVRSRARPEYDPLGAYIGSFLLFPRLIISESFTDNLFSANTGERADLISRFAPEMSLNSDWGRHELGFEGGAEIGVHYDNPDENYQDYFFGTSGRLDVLAESSLSAAIDWENTHEGRGSPEDVGGTSPTEVDTINGSIEAFHPFGRFNATLSGAVRRTDFDDVLGTAGNINNDDRDRYRVVGSARLGYVIQPEYEAFVLGSYNFVDYDAPLDDAGLNRDSDGFDIVAGAAIDFTGLIFGDFFVGYQRQEFDDGRLETVDGVSAGADITWNVTPLTTVNGSLVREVRETTAIGASGREVITLGLTVDHELLRNLILSASGEAETDDFSGVGRNDKNFRAGFSANYRINRNFFVGAGYNYRRRDSDAAGADFQENIVFLSLGAQY